MPDRHGLPSPTIHRLDLAITDEQDVDTFAGARVLHVAPTYLGATKGNPRIEVWVHVDPERQPRVKRRFHLRGTGHLADVDPATHVGTVIHDLPGGRGVWHLFDGGEVGSTCARCSSRGAPVCCCVDGPVGSPDV